LLLDAQYHGDVHHLIEVPRHAVQLVDDVFAKRGSDVEVMSTDRQIHQVSFRELLGADANQCAGASRLLQPGHKAIFAPRRAGGGDIIVRLCPESLLDPSHPR
jgi:hypothetical protein